VCSRLHSGDNVLELGCGYGRVTLRLAAVATRVVGIDTSTDSLDLARELDASRRCEYLRMDALRLTFRDDCFDAVVCVQNGVCAFGVDQVALVREALRVTRPGGGVILSTYTDAFWPERLAWFEAQASEGLVGAIDHRCSREGVIVCTDGFRAGRMAAREFAALGAAVGRAAKLTEVDASSLFCEFVK
jgi:2-polyprenyl-6-hydroxyphenyl methylase/3-demethylubiquinone-9 3-methyltransferase